LKPLLRHALRTAFYLGLAGLVASALGLSYLRYWLLPRVAAHRAHLATHLAAVVGAPVQIETLSARLRGFKPELAIAGLDILDPQGRPALRFAQVRLSIDPFRSFADHAPRFDRAEIIGPKLSLRRKPDGGIAVLGLAPAGDGPPPAWLLADGRIEILDAEVDWQDERAAAPPLKLGRTDLSLDNRQGRHRLGAEVHLPEALGRSLRVVLEARRAESGANWQGTAYLETQGLDIALLQTLLPASAFGLRGGSADARLWLHWADGLGSATGEFKLARPTLVHRAGPQGERALSLASLAGHFHWQARPDGWRLDLAQFRPALREPWPATRLALESTRRGDGGLDHIAAAASRLDLGDIAAALRGLGLPDPETTAALAGLAPHGTLENAGLFYAPDAAAGQRLGLYGQFRAVGFEPWRNIPGVAGLGGDFRGTDAAGRVDFALDGLTLARLKLKHPVGFLASQARLFWEQTADAWWLDLPRFSARTPDLALALRLRAALYKRPDQAPFLELLARLSEVDAARLVGYLPCAVVSATCRWLEQALESGRIPQADMLFSGFVDDFPFYHGEGVFQTEFDADHVKLRFNPDWPPVTEASAHVAFRGPGVVGTAQGGQIGAGRIVEVHADIPNLLHNTQLTLTGKARAGVADSLDVLAHSPLRRIPERLRRIAEVSGEADITLDLFAPLDAASAPIVVTGTADLHRAGFHLRDPKLGVEAIEGLLHFNAEGIHADRLQARILGGPATVAVADEHQDIALAVRGSATLDELRKQFPSPAWNPAQGTLGYRLDLRFPANLDAKSAPLRLALQSDLKGVALDLPAPLGKPEQDERPLMLETRFQAGAAIPVKLAYGAEVKAQAQWVADRLGQGFKLDSADLALGQPLPATGGGTGLGLYLHLDEWDASAWRDWWDRKLADGGGAGGIPAAPLRELSLHCGQLLWQNTPLGPASLRLKQAGGRWQGHLYSAYAKGDIDATPDLVAFDLESLKIPKPADAPKPPPSANPAAAAPEIDPAILPSLKLHAHKLYWRNAELGPLDLATERHAHGMVIRHLSLKTEGHALELRGDWTRTPARPASTHLEGKLHIDNLGDFLAHVGQGGHVRETQTDAEFTLDWPGSPKRYAAAAVAGKLKLNLGKGSLLKVEPGLGRMIGMLNLNTLWRRLSLDFSDLFGEGLAYDGSAGTFKLGGGQAITEGLLIDAVSARILVNGRIGLASKDMDQTVTVIPHTAVALPIAGALAGGPAVGAAMFVAQRLIGEQVEHIAATHYALRGPWEHPTITRVNHDYMPLDVLDRAWGGIKDLSGFGPQQEEQSR